MDIWVEIWTRHSTDNICALAWNQITTPLKFSP